MCLLLSLFPPRPKTQHYHTWPVGLSPAPIALQARMSCSLRKTLCNQSSETLPRTTSLEGRHVCTKIILMQAKGQLLLGKLLLDPFLVSLFPLGVPPAERRPLFEHVAQAPLHPRLVELPVDGSVRADDVKLALLHPRQEFFGDLGGGPRFGGSVSRGEGREGPACGGSELGPGPAGDEEVDRDGGGEELVRERFGEGFDGLRPRASSQCQRS
jgi:hypothetical protein